MWAEGVGGCSFCCFSGAWFSAVSQSVGHNLWKEISFPGCTMVRTGMAIQHDHARRTAASFWLGSGTSASVVVLRGKTSVILPTARQWMLQSINHLGGTIRTNGLEHAVAAARAQASSTHWATHCGCCRRRACCDGRTDGDGGSAKKSKRRQPSERAWTLRLFEKAFAFQNGQPRSRA